MSVQQHVDNSLSMNHSSVENSSEINVVFPRNSPGKLAWLDLKESLQKWPIWMMLAYQDIKLRYRRSVLGPFWLTLSMAITVYSMGFLYAHLFHVAMDEYYPFLVAGMLSWTLISSTVTDLTDTFVLADGLIKQIKLPYTLYIHRVAARNFMIFFHNIIVLIPIFIIFHHSAKINLDTLLIIPGLALIYINAIVYGLILAMIGARYRDISQVIKSLVQVVFFVTPVMWSPNILPEHSRYAVYLNPFYSLIEIVRAPMIGTMPTFFNYCVVLALTAFGGLVAAKMLARYRTRIIYWI
jgi:ABC-type polysaccharide/polyol phosphate export permease